MGNLCCGPRQKGGQRLGGGSSGSSGANEPLSPGPSASASTRHASAEDDRAARAAAAEARAKAAASKGVQQGGGKLSDNLQKQKSIGPGNIPVQGQEGEASNLQWRVD
ncbi:hypothetical protein HK102_008078 [Quaeritorhiza haematococci]|nr:hypothetical protein HK102_008078 [Quaeritorhiza haematococci]